MLIDKLVSSAILTPATDSKAEAAAVSIDGTGDRWQRMRIDGMVIECLIGIHEYEHQAPQRVSIDVELVRREPNDPTEENYSRVMCYETVINKIRSMAVERHIKLVETFAERIAEFCQLEYPEITALNVTVNKIDVFSDVAKVGVRLERVFEPTAESVRKTRSF